MDGTEAFHPVKQFWMKHNRSVGPHEPPRRLPSGAAVMQVGKTNALTLALFAEWARAGYAGLSLERVAKRAGVGKAALYRRWPSKAVMVSESLARVGLTLTDSLDTGSLHGDIQAALLSLRRVLRRPFVRRILLDLHAEMSRSSELATAVQSFQAARRERANALLDRAIARGELHETVDREMANDLLGAPLYWRLAVVRGTTDGDYINRLAIMLSAALSADPSNAQLIS